MRLFTYFEHEHLSACGAMLRHGHKVALQFGHETRCPPIGPVRCSQPTCSYRGRTADDTQTAETFAPGVDDFSMRQRKRRLRRLRRRPLSIYQQSGPDSYKLVGNISTGPMGRTARLVPELKRYFVAVRSMHHSAEVLVFEVLEKSHGSEPNVNSVPRWLDAVHGAPRYERIMTGAMRILLVEDERKVASFIARALRENTYAVDVAESGQKRLNWEVTFPTTPFSSMCVCLT